MKPANAVGIFCKCLINPANTRVLLLHVPSLFSDLANTISAIATSIFGSIALFGDANCKEEVKAIAKSQMRKNGDDRLQSCQDIRGVPMVFSVKYTHAGG